MYDAEETLPLPREWNYFNSAPTLKPEDFANEEEKMNYLGGKVQPKIVSYVLKPWLKENINAPYANLYWEKMEQSPYYEEIKKMLKRNNKFDRFMKLNLKEKLKFLISGDINKYITFIKNLFR